MHRDLSRLAETTLDLLIIGGGIQGSCIAWDAALRGLQVGLIERDRFGGGTSANSLRIVHGGLRYLARGNLSRMRESVRERSVLLRIAPGLVEPLPVVVPTGPPGIPGKAAFAMILALANALSMGRNRDLPPTSILAGGRILSRRECRQLLPGLPDDRITGAALWYDAQLSDPEALVRGFAGAASALGANVADRAEAEELTVQAGAVTGAWVRDRITGERHSVRARVVIVAAGPWSGELVRRAADRSVRQPVRHALALNLVLSRRVAETAVGLISHRGRAEDPVGGGRRILFLVPQSQGALLGTWYGLVPPHEEAVALERGAQMLLEDINREWPGAGIGPGDVIGRLWGRLPLKEGYESGRHDALAERALLQDHRREGLANLLSVESVKLTTARAVAERVLDRVLAMLGERPRPCRTREVRLPGAAQTESVASVPVPYELQFTSRVEAEGRETIG